LKFVRARVTEAYPALFVTALAALRVPIPCIIAKFTVDPLFGKPRVTTRAVSGTLRDAPEATQRYGVVTPMSKEEDVAVTTVLTDLAGL
jgi:hypothetical protein